ncbi:MHS family MFS transporter [Burkholderia sp. Ac-20349]|nr:MHS family MFS transporter [Burkholderia sp. Ac-20349]
MHEITQGAAGAADPSAERRSKKATRAAIIGNVLEWYDFGIYAFVAAILAAKFFPAEDPLASQMSVFLAYGIGFAARPLGGAIIGRIGDLNGRRSALFLTMYLMAGSTVAIGLLPTYTSVGVFAPVLLVCARLVQGFAAGGEWGGSTAFIVEWAPQGRRGYYGSFQQMSVVGGILLGSATAAVFSTALDTDQMTDWGWRIPFLLGGLLGPVGIFLRRTVDETPAFKATLRKDAPRPAIVNRLCLAGKAFGFTVLWTVSTYVFLTFMPTWAAKNMGVSPTASLWANTASLVVLMVCVPLMGQLSDKIGRKPLLLSCCALFILLPWPAFSLLVQSQGSVLVLAVVQCGFAVVISAFSGPGPAAIAEIFPTEDRSTLMSIGYAVSVAIFGGFAAVICLWLISTFHSPIAHSFYLIGAAVVSAVAILTIKETAFSKLS